jgi:opacity protein-like surface antigen
MKWKTILLTSCLLLGGALTAAGQTSQANLPDAPQASGNLFQGVLRIGGVGMDNRDYAGRVSEYVTANQGGRGAVGLQFWGNRGKFHFDFQGAYFGDERDQSHSMYFDVHRFWRTTVRYRRLPHRLDHDPLDVMDAGKGAIIVRADDSDPGRQYSIMHGELEVDSRFIIPQLKGTEFRFGYRDERRDGHRQASTMSKCANCHISSVTRKTDQVTQDFTAGLRTKIKRLTLEYSYLNRRFEERGPTPLHTYDRAEQPVTQQRIFDNRVSYDVDNGPLPFNQIPKVSRESHSVRARLELPRDAALNLNFVRAFAENDDAGIGVDTTAWSARLGVPFGKQLYLTARFRQQQIRGDDIFVDIAEQTAVAGPQLGLTYQQAYPSYGTVDYLRLSAESRRPTTVDFDLSYRPAERTTVRLGYQWERVRRDHAAEFQAPYETRRNTFRATLNTRTEDRRWTVRSRYTFDHVVDPFALFQAGWMPVIQPFPSPGTPPSPLLGTQYFTLYRARQANLSNQPARGHFLEESVTWSANAKFSLSGHFRMRRLTNDRLNRSDWHNSSMTPGVEAWFAPHPKFSLNAAYYYYRERGDTLFILPVFDG